MNWSDDLDFMSSKKVSIPQHFNRTRWPFVLFQHKLQLVKQGRRAENAGSPEKTELLDNAVDNISNSPPEALLRTRKTGKWADEGGKSAK